MVKTAAHQSTRQRAAILFASATLMTAPEIAAMWRIDESHVRKVIHEFNERGFDSLCPRYGAVGRAGSTAPSAARSSRSPVLAPIPRRWR